MNNHEKQERVFKRQGPAGLALQMGMVAAEYYSAQKNPDFSRHDIEQMLAGIRRYQAHDFVRPEPPHEEVWQSGTVRLYRVAPADGNADRDSAKDTPGLLLVPSLINRSAILDLLAEKSFARWMAGKGIRVFLLDWGDPVQDAALATMDDLLDQRLVPAMRFVADACGGKPDVMGYCMGATMTVAACVLAKEIVRGAIFVAGPWDFAAGDDALHRHVKAGTPQAMQIIAQRNMLPRQWIENVFAASNTDHAVRKFIKFAAMDPQSDEARLFVAVEDWLNDGVDLPADIARTCIADWYGRNLPGMLRWQACGTIVDPAHIAVPCLVVASRKDRLVAFEGARALTHALPRATLLAPDTGHIGMMVGRHAETQLWTPVFSWLRRNG